MSYYQILEAPKKAFCYLLLNNKDKKRYENNKNLSQDVIKKVSKLQFLKEDYTWISKNNNTSQELLQDLLKQIQVLTNELQEIHPYYKPLIKYEGTEWNKL